VTVHQASRRSLFLILAFALVLDVFVANSMSQTMDEADHLEYGAKILRGQPDRSGPYMDIKTPVTALNALPRWIGAHVDGSSSPRIRKFFMSLTMARFASILAALALIFFIHQMVYELYGRAAALAAALLAALSPNLIAHGTLATTDGYFALGVLSALYFLHRYLSHPTLANACFSGLALAFAQLMKPLAAFLYPVAGVFLVLAAMRQGAARITGRQLAVYAAVSAMCVVGVLNVGYLFDRTFLPLGSYDFESASFRSLQNPGLLQKIPVPIPYPVLQGLDQATHNDAIGVTYGNIYLLGNLRRNGDADFHGFKSYYLVAWLVKEPIALQILFVWGLLRMFRFGRDRGFSVVLLVATVVLVAGLSLFSKAQIGIRHILPALAIEIVIAASVFSEWSSYSRRRKSALGLLVVWLAASSLSYYPHMIPYMNETVFDRKLAYRVLADSNLDWGQDMSLVRKFLKDNPDVVLDPDVPVSGRILVSANRLVGVAPKEKGPLVWALQYKPIAHVGYAHLLFQVSHEDATLSR
jgi:Dolichyl-phosphate-mannose-protein mannosyltransferase